MKKYWKELLLLIGYTVLVMIPLITKSQIYNHIVGYDQPRSDFRDYTALVSSWINGEPVSFSLYNARTILAYPIIAINKITEANVDSIYITICFVLLVLTGIVIYYTIRELVNKESGFLSIAIAIFCTTGILGMFYFGMICSIVNMYIFLLFGILAAIKWLTKGKIIWLVGSILSVAIFSLFHTTAIYFPYFAAIIFVLIIACKLINKKESIWKPIILLVILLVVNTSVSFTALPNTILLNKYVAENAEVAASKIIITKTPTETTNETEKPIKPENSFNYLSNSPLSLTHFILYYLSISTVGIMIVTIFFLTKCKENIKLRQETKYLLIILSGIVLALSIGTFTPIAIEPVRSATDLATILALITATMAGIMIINAKSKIPKVAISLLLSIGLITNIIPWVMK